MTEQESTQRCSAFVYSAEDWILQCRRPANHEMEGSLWCWQHKTRIEARAKRRSEDVSLGAFVDSFRFTGEVPPPDCERAAKPPTTLYRMFDGSGQLLYVGISSRGPRRFPEHRQRQEWWREVAEIRVEHYDVPIWAVEAERQAIEQERPLHNVVHAVRDSFGVAAK